MPLRAKDFNWQNIIPGQTTITADSITSDLKPAIEYAYKYLYNRDISDNLKINIQKGNIITLEEFDKMRSLLTSIEQGNKCDFCTSYCSKVY